MVCISHSLHKHEDCQLSQFWWDTLGPPSQGLRRCQQHRGRVKPLTIPPPGPWSSGREGGISLHLSNNSHSEEHCTLLLDRLLHTHSKPSFCLASSQAHSLDLTTEANNSVPLHIQLAPRRERIYSVQIRELSPELCFSACNHYF